MSTQLHSLLTLRDALRILVDDGSYTDVERETKMSSSAAGRLKRADSYTRITRLGEFYDECSSEQEALKRSLEHVEELIDEGQTVTDLLQEVEGAKVEAGAEDAGSADQSVDSSEDRETDDEADLVALQIDDLGSGWQGRRDEDGEIVYAEREDGEDFITWERDERQYIAYFDDFRIPLSHEQVLEAIKLWCSDLNGYTAQEAQRRWNDMYPDQVVRLTKDYFTRLMKVLDQAHGDDPVAPHQLFMQPAAEIAEQVLEMKANAVSSDVESQELEFWKNKAKERGEKLEDLDQVAEQLAKEGVEDLRQVVDLIPAAEKPQIVESKPSSHVICAADIHMCAHIKQGALVGNGEKGMSCERMFEEIGPQARQMILERYAGKNIRPEAVLLIPGDLVEAVFGHMHEGQEFEICHKGNPQLKRSALWVKTFIIDPVLSVLPEDVKLRIILLGGNHDRLSASHKGDKDRTAAQVVAQMIYFMIMGTDQEKRVEFERPVCELNEETEPRDVVSWYGFTVEGPDGREHPFIATHGDKRSHTPERLISKFQAETGQVFDWYTIIKAHKHKWDLKAPKMEQDSNWMQWHVPSIVGPNKYASEQLMKFGYRALCEFEIEEGTVFPWARPMWLNSD